MELTAIHGARNALVALASVSLLGPLNSLTAQDTTTGPTISLGIGLGWNPNRGAGNGMAAAAFRFRMDWRFNANVAVGLESSHLGLPLPDAGTDRLRAIVVVLSPTARGWFVSAGAGSASARLRSSELDVINRRDGWGTALAVGVEPVTLLGASLTVTATWVLQHFKAASGFPSTNHLLLITVGPTWRL